MKLSVKELAVFGAFAGLFFAAKKLMEPLPNIHPIAVMIIVMTVCYRRKALFPIYTYVLLEGIFGGFTAWWVPYLYVWAVLWAVIMLLPQKLPKRWAPLIYGLAGGLHGLAFGLLYAPAEALLYGFSRKALVAWILAGLPYDCIHGISNFILGTVLSYPLIQLIHKIDPSRVQASLPDAEKRKI